MVLINLLALSFEDFLRKQIFTVTFVCLTKDKKKKPYFLTFFVSFRYFLEQNPHFFEKRKIGTVASIQENPVINMKNHFNNISK